MNEKRDKERLKQIGMHIRVVRISAGMSLNDLAASCDVEKSNISMIENGKKDFTITTLLELARGIGKHPKKLLEKDFDFLDDWD